MSPEFKLSAPCEVKIYEEKDPLIVGGDRFTLISTRTGLIQPSTYLAKNNWREWLLESKSVERLPGKFLVCGNAARNNYYHWVYQVFAAILYFYERKEEYADCTILGPKLTRWMREYLELLPGIRYREAQPNVVYLIEKAYFSNIMWGGMSFNPHHRVVELFEQFADGIALKNGPEKIYISREDSPRRTVANEDELSEMLADLGFERVLASELTVRDQISMFRSARHIVAAHGAGLVNLLFTRPGAIVTELFQENYLNGCFWAICQKRNIVHQAIVSPVLTQDDPANYHKSAMMADIPAIKAGVMKGLEGSLGRTSTNSKEIDISESYRMQHHDTSYSQFGEDRILFHLFKNKACPGSYVDIGAYHPLVYSNTALLYANGWRGINIDVSEGSVEMFRKERPEDISLQLAVSNKNGVLPCYYFGSEAGQSPLNTLDHDQAVRWQASFRKNFFTREIDVSTLDNVLDEHWRHGQIDFMNIDVEGMELQVLQGLSFNKYRPKCIAIESHSKSMEDLFVSPIHKFLSGIGYRLMSHSVITSIYLA